MKTKFSKIDAASDEIRYETRLISDTLWETEYFKTHLKEWETIETALKVINANVRAMQKDGNAYKEAYEGIKKKIMEAMK